MIKVQKAITSKRSRCQWINASTASGSTSCSRASFPLFPFRRGGKTSLAKRDSMTTQTKRVCDGMFSVAVSTALPLTGVAPSSGRSPASSEAKHASSDCCTAVLPPRFHFCGLGSRGSRSSTPRVARNRTLRHRHTMHAKQSTASTAKVTATPTNAGRKIN